jgi:hypothetical protein
MTTHRLLRLRHDRENVGFLSASLLVEDPTANRHWLLRLESPSTLDLFRSFLGSGGSMSFSMITREGHIFRGEACVSSLSDATDGPTSVALAGVGPLHGS